MHVIIDQDVLAVAEFLQERIPQRRLVEVAAALAAMAPTLWGAQSEPEAARGPCPTGRRGWSHCCPTDRHVETRRRRNRG
jgi:hypothetical protein